MGHEREIHSKSPEKFEVQSVRRVLKEYLDCVRKHRRCKKFKKWPQRKKSQHLWCWAIESVREKEDPSQYSYFEEGVGGLNYKSFGIHDFDKVYEL
jgi:hypothetical protein